MAVAVPEPPLLDQDGKLLPQTKDKPRTDDPLFDKHASMLFRAIVEDDPELARSFFFPIEAYEKVKGIAKPARDWKHRLWAHFVRDVHDYHRKLGPDPDKAVLERIDVSGRPVRWMKPGSEGNRIGYYRVTHTRIRGRRGDGRRISLELTAMISWRGNWYVVHLNGFK